MFTNIQVTWFQSKDEEGRFCLQGTNFTGPTQAQAELDDTEELVCLIPIDRSEPGILAIAAVLELEHFGSTDSDVQDFLLSIFMSGRESVLKEKLMGM